MAVIENLVTGNDRLTRSAIIRTKNGVTNRPVTKHYPLELADEKSIGMSNSERNSTTRMKQKSDNPVINERPQRNAAQRARQRLAEWTENICAPPEDVQDSD